MTGTYRAVEVSAPGTLRVVERALVEPGKVSCGFGWTHAESVTPMRQRSPVRTEA